MLTYDLTGCEDIPRYQYLYQCIREDILSGKLPHRDRLPSKRALALHLNIGIGTVANAYVQLVDEGFISAEERKGYFVQKISHHSVPSATLPEHLVPPQEHEYSIDFKANRISLKLFPVATWNQMMRKVLCQNDGNLFKTIPFNGLFELRLAIADYLARNCGMRVMPSQIVIGAGTEYLYGRLAQMFGRAYTFGFEDPGYHKLAAITASHRNICKYIPIDQKGLLIDKLEESGADVVHVSPANHFPTGIVMPMSRRVELFEWAYRVQKRVIIEDGYDSEFRYRGNYLPPLFAKDTQNKIIYLNTFSKTMVPSLRISYMVLPPKLLQLYEQTMSFYSCTVSSFEQYALARFISEGYFERHIHRLRNYYRKIRELLLNAIRNSKLGAIVEIVEHGAGTHFLLKVSTTLTDEEVHQKAAAEDMLVTVYADYCRTKQSTGRCTLVINYACINQEDIPKLVHGLERLFPECA